MPAIDPRHRQRFVFKVDESLPASEQPAFLWRPLTAAEYRDAIKGDVQVADCLTKVVVSWEKVKTSKGEDAVLGTTPIDEVLTPVEMREFMDRILMESTLTTDQKKDLERQLRIGTDNSAAPAPTATGSAENPV